MLGIVGFLPLPTHSKCLHESLRHQAPQEMQSTDIFT